MLLIQCILFLLLRCLLIFQLPPEALADHVLKAPGLPEWFEGAAEVGNPDALLLALKTHDKVSVDSEVFSRLLPNPFSPNKLFSVDHLSSLANCLKVPSSFLCVYLSCLMPTYF